MAECYCYCCGIVVSLDSHLTDCLKVPPSVEKKIQASSRPHKLELEPGVIQSVEAYLSFLKSIPSAADDRHRTPLSRPDHIRYRFYSVPSSRRKAKDNITFLFKLLVESGLVAMQALCFRNFLDLTLMQQLLSYMESRAVSAGRIYQLILTLTKALHFLAFFSVSRGIPVQASSLPTWDFLTNSGKLQRGREHRRVNAQKILGPAANRCMTRQELSLLYSKCLSWVDQTPKQLSKAYAQDYLAHLVVLILLSIPTPRTQILRNLTLNETLLADGGEYVLSFDGETLKSKRPLVHVLPGHLTKPLNFWLQRCKPLVCKLETSTVFPRGNGNKRNDWRQLTRQITMQYLQKPIAPSKFRSCICCSTC